MPKTTIYIYIFLAVLKWALSQSKKANVWWFVWINERLLNQAVRQTLIIGRTIIVLPINIRKVTKEHQVRKSFHFHKGITWVKKENEGMFCVIMGSNAGCWCVNYMICIFWAICRRSKGDIGLQRDDQLTVKCKAGR